MPIPKTIKIHLPTGEPRGLRIAEITTRLVKAVCIPRTKLDEAKDRLELSRVGVYFLFGEDEETAKPVVYIGEAEDVYSRLKQHNRNKDFWTTAIAVTSKDDNLNKACVKFIEYHCYEVAKQIGRYKLENNSLPTKSAISETDTAYSLDFFENTSILLSVLGYPVFDQLKKAKKQEQFICKGKKAIAYGEMVEDGFVIFKGSAANEENADSAQPWIVNNRAKLITDGTMVLKGDVYEFTQDKLLSSPSLAAAVILARSANGWTEWKDKKGKTLDELKRK